MSNAQTKIEMWVLAEVFDNDPSTSIFTSLEAALDHCSDTEFGEEEAFEQFCIDARESGTGARMDLDDDYIVLIKSEVVA